MSDAINLRVVVLEKDETHPAHGHGYPDGYYIFAEGSRIPLTWPLRLQINAVYRFWFMDDIGYEEYAGRKRSMAIHPFYISSDQRGGNSFKGVIKAFSRNDGYTKGTWRFVANTSTVDKHFLSRIYYQCGVHADMGGPIDLVDPSAAAAPTTTTTTTTTTGAIDIQLLVSGLEAVTAIVESPWNPDEIFVVEQRGIVMRLNVVDRDSSPLEILDLTEQVGRLGIDFERDYDERGLLGLAFRTDQPHSAYVYYTTNALRGIARPPLMYNCISKFTWMTSLAGRFVGKEPSEQILLRMEKPLDPIAMGPVQFTNHNGGSMAFMPNGRHLMVGVGDGNVGRTAQDFADPHGSILRLDTDIIPPVNPSKRVQATPIPPARGNPWGNHLWAHGFRNPWGLAAIEDPHFDMGGYLLVADVGLHTYEELNVVSLRGGNYGWPKYEGPSRPEDPTVMDPILYYRDSDLPGMAIIGGDVRQSSHPTIPGAMANDQLVDHYVFGDYSGKILAAPMDEIRGLLRGERGSVKSMRIVYQFPKGLFVRAMGGSHFVVVETPPGQETPRESKIYIY